MRTRTSIRRQFLTCRDCHNGYYYTRGIDHPRWCNGCLSRHLIYCQSCGTAFPEDKGASFCPACTKHKCRACRLPYPPTDPADLCAACRDQHALF